MSLDIGDINKIIPRRVIVKLGAHMIDGRLDVRIITSQETQRPWMESFHV